MTLQLTGELILGSSRLATSERFQAANPSDGTMLEPPFSAAGPAEVARACAMADSAFETFSRLDSATRAAFLERVADEIEALGDELIERAHLESGLPIARLTGERGRTANQLRLFASELREGSWMGLRIDPALPERQPLPRPDLRMIKVALGPVAVFGASNFPLAFSVAGGDTASALAAGCPVVVKGHPAHPGTSELVGRAIAKAVSGAGLPEGVFSLLNGTSNELGAALVRDPRIKAVGFTGSRAGGLALMKIAADRPEPIPVYAEMSAVNPVLLMPGALEERGEQLGQQYAGSLSLGSGQFCTNPGIVLAIETPALESFVQSASEAVSKTGSAVMLTSGIHRAFEQGLDRLARKSGIRALARGVASTEPNRGCPALFSVSLEDFEGDPELAEEVFGASSLLVKCKDAAAMQRALTKMEGQLTATVHFAAEDEPVVATVLPTLKRKAGRIIANGWPTGVEVSHAMVHGGPFPATSDGRSTSVGSLAIDRFLRPVCYQDFPDSLLPAPLKNGAQESIPHRRDGKTVI